MKKILFCCIAFFISSYFFATTSQINSDSVKAYRQAQEYFEKQEYGKALKYVEDSILFRKQESEYELKVLHNALAPKKVVNAGTQINNVLKVLEDRGEKESIRILTYYIKLKGIDFFEDNIENIRSYINEIRIYPEAYKLMGDIYKLEGEYDFAEEYYQLALNNAHILDIPNQKYEILYTLAEISKLKNDLPEMEKRLLVILIDDPYYKDRALFNSMMGTIKTNKDSSMEKYFTLYRANSYYCLNAYNELVDYYLSQNEEEKALRLSALSVLTGFSKVYDILVSRNPVYSYENLKTYFEELTLYDDVVEWGTKNNVWKSYYDLAKISYECGYDVFSKDLLKVLIKYLPESYWQKTSVLLLETIN